MSLVMLLNFIAHDVMAHYMLIALEGAKAWPLHALNILISGGTIFALIKLGANRFLYSAIFLYAIYNQLVLFEYVISPVGFHANYVIVARIQMLFELLFMILISGAGSYVWNRLKPSHSYRYFVDRIFADRFRLGLARLV